MTETAESDRDLALVEATPRVKLSAALHGVAGGIAAISGLQFVTSASFLGEDAWMNALPWSLLGLGAIQVGLALLVLKNRHPAAVAASANAVLIAVGSLAWLILGITSGLFSCMALIGVPAAGAAAIIAPFTLGQTKRGWEAKKRLQESGIELGL